MARAMLFCCHMSNVTSLLLAGSLLASLGACSDNAENVGSRSEPLVAVCAESMDSLPPGSWQCGAPRTMECTAHPGTANPSRIYVVPNTNESCPERLSVDKGPFAVGEHTIIVTQTNDSAPATELCRSTLTVEDTMPPVAHPGRTELWPPNHELHAISATDCANVVDSCDPNVDVQFTEASSDEPPDALGDGSTTPDMVFEGPRVVRLRAERQGTSNGRVYTLHFRARDASGNVADGACSVAVPHDQSAREAIADAPLLTVKAPSR